MSAICIRRKYLGGSEDQSFDDFVDSTIQDAEAAIEVASTMLDEHPSPHEWNSDEPEFYETFEIIDMNEFRRALEALQHEYA